MKITRTKKNLQEKKLYEGYIVKVEEDEEYGIARLYIELDDYPDEWFYTSLQMEESGKVNSRFNQFFETMGVFDVMDNFELKELENVEVLATLQQGRNGYFYVKQLYLKESDDETLLMLISSGVITIHSSVSLFSS